MTRNDKPRQKVSLLNYRHREHLRYWRVRIFKQNRSPYYYVHLQYQGQRHKLSLETSNLEAAAARARALYDQIRTHGWEATLANRSPQRPETTTTDCTLGAYISKAKATADIAPRTLETYSQAVRKIASDMLNLPLDGTRYDKA